MADWIDLLDPDAGRAPRGHRQGGPRPCLRAAARAHSASTTSRARGSRATTTTSSASSWSRSPSGRRTASTTRRSTHRHARAPGDGSQDAGATGTRSTSPRRWSRQNETTTSAVGVMVYRLVDHIAEYFLDLVDAIDDEIDELEDGIEDWPAAQVRERISDPAARPPARSSHGLADARRRSTGRGPADRHRRGPRGASRATSSSTSRTSTTSSCARSTGSTSRATCSRAPATTSRRRSPTTRTR